jgi:hypothetical protein
MEAVDKTQGISITGGQIFDLTIISEFGYSS